MADQQSNGKIIYERFDRLDHEIQDLRDDLATSVRELTTAVTRLADKVDAFALVASTSVPIKIIFWMFGILVLALAGVEGVQALFKLHIP